MMRTLWSGVTGLQAHQTRMDVIGNNIANVNTVGFKKSEVVFEDLISQTLEIAHGPSEERGGTNGMGVGLGVKIASISQVHTQGQMQTTGKNTDLALSGNGFFTLAGATAADLHYTRNGSFHLDGDGMLVAANGYKVQGWMAELDATSGKMVVNSATSPIENLQIEVGKTVPANATTKVTLSGNLNSENKLAIDPITVEYTKDDVDRDITITFEHAHPTLPFYTWKATWANNPPTGFLVGDAVTDFNTGYQAQGIVELDASGKVVGLFRNTDGILDTNAELEYKYLAVTPPIAATSNTGTGKLAQVVGNDNGNPVEGYWRVRFVTDNTYDLDFSDDFNPVNGTGNWTSVGLGIPRGQTYVAGDLNGDGQLTAAAGETAESPINQPAVPWGQITIQAGDWTGNTITDDVFYFQTEVSDGNGILQLPSEKPRQTGIAVDSAPKQWGMFVTSKPEETDQPGRFNGLLSGVQVNEGMAAIADTRPTNLTYTNWRATFFDVGDPTRYALTYSTDGGTTWYFDGDSAANGDPAIGVGAYLNMSVDNPQGLGGPPAIAMVPPNVYLTTDDIVSANGELRIQAENWTDAPAAGDIYEFRLNYTSSPTYDRGFFTINDWKSALGGIDNTGVVGGGGGTLDNVTIAATAPLDTFTLTFTDATHAVVTDSAGNVINPNYEITTQTLSSSGITLTPADWTAGFVAGDVVSFSTVQQQNLLDITLPDGSPSAEQLTFTPNTNDTTMNMTDAGNPVTAALNSQNDYQYATSVNVYDSLGKAHTLRIFFERKSVNEWMWSVEDPAPHDPNDVKIAGYGILAFNADGTYDSGRSVTFNSEVGLSVPDNESGPVQFEGIYFDPAGWGGAPPTARGANAVQIIPDFSELVQYSAQNDGEVFSQDGYGKGTLTSFTVNRFGYITGLFDNGQTQDVGQLAVAGFNNPAGLMQEGDSMYRVTGNSGLPHIGVAGVAGRGTMSGGSLEMSNVDLSEEFTNMIVTQRGFQASSRSITTADQMLQELLALKR